jgi:hypothetical protein
MPEIRLYTYGKFYHNPHGRDIKGPVSGRYYFSFDLFNKKDWLGVAFERNFEWYDGQQNKWWTSHTSHWSFGINLKRWVFGQFHDYYDGPHCSYNFGPFYYITSNNDKCKKCYDDK